MFLIGIVSGGINIFWMLLLGLNYLFFLIVFLVVDGVDFYGLVYML